MMPGKNSPRSQSIASQGSGTKSPQTKTSPFSNLGLGIGGKKVDEKKNEEKKEDKKDEEKKDEGKKENVGEKAPETGKNEKKDDEDDDGDEYASDGDEYIEDEDDDDDDDDRKKKEEERAANERIEEEERKAKLARSKGSEEEDKIMKDMGKKGNSGKKTISQDMVLPDVNTKHAIISDQKYFIKRKSDSGRDIIQIKPEGRLSKGNMTFLSYEIGSARDITSNIDKKNAKANRDPSDRYIGMRDLKIIYPDRSHCTTILVTDCVIQNRTDIGKDSGRFYGLSTINIGLPIELFSHIQHCGAKSGVDIVNKDSVKENAGYHWYQMDLASINFDDVGFVGSDGFTSFPIRTALSNTPNNIRCDVAMNVSITQTAPKNGGSLDFKSRGFSPSFKPVSITLKDNTNISQPPFIPTKKEDMGIIRTGKDMASAGFLSMMLENSRI